MRIRSHRRVKLVGRAAAFALLLGVAAPSAAEAGFWCWLLGSDCRSGSTAPRASEERAAPEIDPNALAGAVALAFGGAAIARDRLRRR